MSTGINRLFKKSTVSTTLIVENALATNDEDIDQVGGSDLFTWYPASSGSYLVEVETVLQFESHATAEPASFAAYSTTCNAEIQIMLEKRAVSTGNLVDEYYLYDTEAFYPRFSVGEDPTVSTDFRINSSKLLDNITTDYYYVVNVDVTVPSIAGTHTALAGASGCKLIVYKLE